MNTKSETVIWRKEKHRIFENFALELQECVEGGELPESADQDLRYALELQRERVKSKGLKMQYEYVPRGHFPEGNTLGKDWGDNRYISKMDYRTCRFTKSIFRDEKRVYRKSKDMIFYQVLTDVLNPETVGEDSYNCPSCGAISKVSRLQEGCPYCGTFFEMSDLFPKVTNFYHVEDHSATTEEFKVTLAKYMLPFMLVIGIYSVYSLYVKNGNTLLYSLITGIILGALGGLLGYLCWVAKILFRLFKEAGKSMPMLLNTAGSEKRFVTQMQRYSPEFSYQYFSDKAASILRMIIFSENPQELPYYVGEPVGNMFSDIVESSYTGATALKSFQVNGPYCFVTVEVYMDDICEKKGRFVRRRNVFRMQLCRNIAKPIDYRFSIRRINCSSCGSSFDATKQRNCPNCNTRYEIGDEDWFVIKVGRR